MKETFSIGSKYKYCPNGNYWQDVSGIFDERIYLFCDCNKCNGQFYVLAPRKYKLDESTAKRLIEKQRNWNRLNEVKDSINYANMEKVANALKQPNPVKEKQE